MYNTSLLSICIPTYNRGQMLRESIMFMIPVCERHGIQICVADNASPDNTMAIMEELVGKYCFIHYYRHAQNIGSDDNFEFVLKMARTKYRWLMSDTCYVKDIVSLMDDLQEREWDAYILNDPSTRAQYLPKERIVYHDSERVMYDLGWHLSWISCMIYHENLIKEFDFNRYRNSSFNQTALIFEPTAGRSVQICFEPAVIVWNLSASKESGWHYKVFDVMYRQWYLLIFSLPLYYPYETKMKCYADSSKYAMPLQLYFHAQRRGEGKWCLKDLEVNKLFVKLSSTNYGSLYLLGLCPPVVVRCLFFLGHHLNRFLRRIGLK